MTNSKDKEDLEEKQFLGLVSFLFGLKSEDDLRVALKSLLTEREVASISQRLAIAQLANDGHTYKEIEKKLLVSPSTITKVIRNYRELENKFKALLENEDFEPDVLSKEKGLETSEADLQLEEDNTEDKTNQNESAIDEANEVEYDEEKHQVEKPMKETSRSKTFQEMPHSESADETNQSQYKKPNIFSDSQRSNDEENKKKPRKNFFSQLEDLIG